MVQQAPIPIYEERETFYVPYFEIKLRGNKLPRDVVRDVIDVTYEDNIEKIDSFTLTINNWDAEKRKPKYVGLEPKPKPKTKEAKRVAMFEPGNELELHLALVGHARQ
jgi:hypothetical protein